MAFCTKDQFTSVSFPIFSDSLMDRQKSKLFFRSLNRFSSCWNFQVSWIWDHVACYVLVNLVCSLSCYFSSKLTHTYFFLTFYTFHLTWPTEPIYQLISQRKSIHISQRQHLPSSLDNYTNKQTKGK